MNKGVWLVLLAAGFTTIPSIAVAEQQTLGSFFGPQLLTEEEQAAYRAGIRNAKTPQEVEAVRDGHYRLMQARAKEKGVALPEKRPPVGGDLGNFFGPQLMSEEDRAAYRAKIRSAKTPEASEKIRTEQHQEIAARAKEKGIVPPETQVAPAGKGGGGVMGALFAPQLISEEEQMAYRARLRSAKTPEERDQVREQHRRQLQARAKEKGVVLP